MVGWNRQDCKRAHKWRSGVVEKKDPESIFTDISDRGGCLG